MSEASKDKKNAPIAVQKTQEAADEEEDDDQLPLVHAVQSEYYIAPLSNGISLIPEVQKFEQDLKKSSEVKKASQRK